MFSVKKLFANFQPTKALLKWHRKRTAKVVPGDVLAGTQEDHVPRQPSPSRSALSSSSSQPVDMWQSQAAAQQGQSHVSSPVLEDQVRAAGPEGQAATPHSPCCTPSPFSSQMEAPSGQQARAAVAEILPGTREGTCSEEGSLWDISSPRELSQGEEITEQSVRTPEESSSVSTPKESWTESSQSSLFSISVPALSSTGPYSTANAPPPDSFLDHNELSPSPSQLECLSGQWEGAAVGSLPSGAKEGMWSEGDSVWDNCSLLGLSQSVEITEQSMRTPEESSSASLPLELWTKPSQLSKSMDSIPAVSSTSPYTGANAPSPKRFLDHNDLSPSPSQLESLSGQWAGAAVGSWLPVAKEGTWPDDKSVWNNSSLLELSSGQGKTPQPLPPVEDISGQELSPCKAKKVIKIHTIWVNPLHLQALLDPHTARQEGPSSPSSLGREGAQEADADPHSTCPALREPTDTQPAAEEILPAPHAEEGAFAELDRDLNVHSLQGLSQGEQNRDQRCGSAQERLPMPGPREAWAEQRGLQQPTLGARAPLHSISSPYMRPKAPSPEGCARTPSPSQLEGLSVQWVGTALRGRPECSELLDIARDSRGEENSDRPQPPEEDSTDTTLSQEHWEDIEIYSIWVKPSLRAVLLEPNTGTQEGPKCPSSACRKAAEEADADPHSTCPALREPTDTQPAAAGLAAAPQEEGHGTALAAKAQDVAKTAASPALAEQGRPAGPEGQAAAPHSPRGSGRAVLDTLQRWARATLRRIAPVIRRRGHQHEQQTGTEQGVAAVTAPTATEEAGPQG